MSQGVIGSLNTSWDANEAAIKAGREAAISNALSTFIGAIAAIPTGGTSTIAALAAYGPTFLNAYNAYTSSKETDGTTLNRASYIKGFETALAGYDAAVAWQKSEHEDYTNIYVNEYLQLMAAHGGLYTQGASAIDGPLTKEELYSYIHKRSITYDAEGKIVIGEFVDGISKKEDGYYHLIQDYHGNNMLGNTDHTMITHLHLAEVRIKPLEYSKKCQGRNCTDMHRTSYEAYSTHFVSCKDYKTDSFTDACRETWYTCDSNHTNKKKDHQVSTCIKFIQVSLNQSRGCGATFKTCLRVVIDHNLTDSNARGTQHSAKSVYEGENRMHACNIHDTSVSGDHSSTWLCNESPCSNRQVPYCLATCPETGNHGTATTPMHVCEVHELWESGDHSWITPACGVSDHAGDACQIDVSHETSVSCPQENGVSCSYENYYTCSPHTHAYPDPLYACGNHSGAASLSSYHAHIASGTLAGYCTWHTFYECSKSRHVSMTGGCGDTFYKCQERVRGHYRLSCWHRKHNGDRCRFRYWKCQNPSGIPSHTHRF